MLQFKVRERVRETRETNQTDADGKPCGHDDVRVKFDIEPPKQTRFGVTPGFQVYVPPDEMNLYPPGAVFTLQRDVDEPAPVTPGRPARLAR